VLNPVIFLTSAAHSPKKSAWCRTPVHAWWTKSLPSSRSASRASLPQGSFPSWPLWACWASRSKAMGAPAQRHLLGLICSNSSAGLRIRQLRLRAVLLVHYRSTPSAPRSRSATCPLARGELIACFGLTEPHALGPGEHEDARQTSGKDWILNGANCGSPMAHRRPRVVWAMTEEGSAASGGERQPRVCHHEIEHKFSARASVTGPGGFRQRPGARGERAAGRRGLKGPCPPHPSPRWHRLGVIGAAQACLSQLLEYTHERVCSAVRWPHQAIQIPPRRDGAPDHHAQFARAAAGAPEGSGQMTRRTCPWPSGTTAAWPSTSPAMPATCGGRGHQCRICPYPPHAQPGKRHTYEGTETIHQLTIGGS